MITTLLFAFPATLVTVILFFISCSFLQRKISYSLLSGALHKNSKRLNHLYGMAFYIFILGSLLPTLFFIKFFNIEIDMMVLGALLILIPILKLNLLFIFRQEILWKLQIHLFNIVFHRCKCVLLWQWLGGFHLLSKFIFGILNTIQNFLILIVIPVFQ